MTRLIVALLLVPVGPAVRSAEIDAASRLERLAVSFTCVETVTVEAMRGETTDRAAAGIYEYLLVKPRKSKQLPYIFVERRSPKPKQAPWKRLTQPVPLAWLSLRDPDPSMFRVTGSCGSDRPEACNEFTGTHEFQDGLDPREWSGKVWMDERGRIRRIEAVPVNQGRRVDRLVTRGEAGAAGTGPVAGPGRIDGPMFRVDGAVDEIRCEIEFAELLPETTLPVRSACHIDAVNLRGGLRSRWTLLRDFSSCRRFGVEAQEEIDPPDPE